jgi:hypothetical protein
LIVSTDASDDATKHEESSNSDYNRAIREGTLKQYPNWKYTVKLKAPALLLSLFLLGGCSPEVGSKAWCEGMDKKDKGDWTASEAGEYAKSCVFRSDD